MYVAKTQIIYDFGLEQLLECRQRSGRHSGYALCGPRNDAEEAMLVIKMLLS